MKAIILTAGVGSRVRPLTDEIPKCLVKVGNKPILHRMIEGVKGVGITEFIMVTGYRVDQVRQYVSEYFGGLDVKFVHNPRYEETNTGYSLLLAKELVGSDDFIKLDGDVVFERAILESLIHSHYPNCLSIDRMIHLAKEEVKVILAGANKVIAVGKKIDPHKANGESIGIEKLGKEAGKIFFEILEDVVVKEKKLQEYYDDSYTTLVERGIPFHAVDISKYKWVEIDTHEDYQRAQELFRLS